MCINLLKIVSEINFKWHLTDVHLAVMALSGGVLTQVIGCM